MAYIGRRAKSCELENGDTFSIEYTYTEYGPHHPDNDCDDEPEMYLNGVRIYDYPEGIDDSDIEVMYDQAEDVPKKEHDL